MPVAQPEEALRLSFTGHETFPFRYAWMPKAVRLLDDHPDLFGRDDALGILGVGKNMVRSIRHWAETLDLIQPARRSGRWEPSCLGRLLFAEDGWDPYFEDPATAWVLHWKLVTKRDRASAWYLAFTVLDLDTFTRDELADVLMTEASRSAATRVTAASMRRDVDVLIASYIASAPQRAVPSEDTFDSPLVDLGLIEEADRKIYRFRRGPKPSLPPAVVWYAVTEYWKKAAPTEQGIPFRDLMYEPGSPGRAFLLSEDALAMYLDRFPQKSRLRFDETAGVRRLIGARAGGIETPTQFLSDHYVRTRS